MAVDSILTSLHGRKFGLTSSGGVLAREGSTQEALISLMKTTAEVVKNSSGLEMGWQKQTQVVTSVVSSGGSTLNAYGTNVIAAGTATAMIFQIGRPTFGQQVEIFCRTSASEVTFGGTSTAILLGMGTTAFLSQAAGAGGAYLTLRGESTARYSVLSKSTDWVVT